MNSPRPPTEQDMAYMMDALSLITAYNSGDGENDYDAYLWLVNDFARKRPNATIQALTQLAWLMLSTLESSGIGDKEALLKWWGLKFAERREELAE